MSYLVNDIEDLVLDLSKEMHGESRIELRPKSWLAS